MFRLRDYGIEPDIVIMSLAGVLVVMLVLLIVVFFKIIKQCLKTKVTLFKKAIHRALKTHL